MKRELGSRVVWGLGLGIMAALGGRVAVAAPATAVPEKPAPLLSTDFEGDMGGWTALGETAQLSLSREKDTVKKGTSSLGFDYQIQRGQTNAFILPLAEGTLRGAQQFHFWVKTDAPTVLALVAQEKDGGRYLASFWSPGNAWQEVQIAPTDFDLSKDKDDPQDPDGKFDLDQVEGLGFADMFQLLAAGNDEQVQKFVGLKLGAHKLFLDEFSVSTEALPQPPKPAEANAVMLDSFMGPQANWVALKDVKLGIVEGDVFKGTSLQAEYHTSVGAFCGWIRPLSGQKLTGTKALALTVATVEGGTFIVQVEENSGEKYNMMLDVPGNIQPKELTLNFADFKIADDSPHVNNQLDVSDIKHMIVIDINPFIGGKEADNTFWMSNLRALK